MPISEWNLSQEDEERLRSAVDDLDSQADFYDMEWDPETLKLTPKSTYQKPPWVHRWEDSRDQADIDEYIDMDRED